MSNAFDPDWPHGHVTRDGRTARIICTDTKGSQGETIVALVADKNGIESPRNFFQSGHYLDAYAENDLDLINAPAPKRKFVRWVNMYEHTATVFTYEKKEIADRDASAHRTACIRVEFEEGDGL